MQCNVRSLSRNIDALCSFLEVSSFRFNFIAVSETWLKSGEVQNIPGYSFTSIARNSRARGGGVGLFKRANIKCELVPQFFYSYIQEFDFLVVNSTSIIFIAVIYRAPNQNTQTFMQHFEALLAYFTSIN